MPFPGTSVRPNVPPSEYFRRASFEIRVVFTESGIEYKDEVVSLSGAYALNSIPAATVTIAAGRKLKSGRPSKIHATVDKLKIREPVRIDLKITTDSQTPEPGIYGMAGKWCTVFEGYYAGVGYQRSHQSANYTLQFIHWLDDLACSSALNGNWHPGVPHDLAQSAEGDVAAMAGGSGGISNFTCTVDAKREIVKQKNINEDLWGKVIRPLFNELAEKIIGRQENANDGDKNKKGNNAAAKAALEKMPGDSPNPATLPFNVTGNLDLALAMVLAIDTIIKTGLAYSSFWSKLIGEFGAEFLFGVSPAATFANVIPYFGALKREWVTITGAEYNYASFNNSLVSLIESVEIRFAQNPTSAVWAAAGDTKEVKIATVSYYQPLARFPENFPENNTEHRGQIVIKDPPAWIANTIPRAAYGPLSAGIQGVPGDIAPKGGALPPGTELPGTVESNLQGSDIIKAYAKQMFQSEVLHQRRGELSGKLRFDIAPGSVVKIKAPELDIGAGAFSDALDFYAMVTQVSFVINAETHSAGTSFAFTDLRNETENNNPLLTSSAAPVYPESSWVGGPLVKEAMPGGAT